jgi:hypothetical protein
MFRRNQPPREGRTVPDGSNEARLRALGHLLDQRGYDGRGLCILEVADGFEVTGLKIPERGAAYELAQHTEHIPAAELATLMAHLRQQG